MHKKKKRYQNIIWPFLKQSNKLVMIKTLRLLVLATSSENSSEMVFQSLAANTYTEKKVTFSACIPLPRSATQNPESRGNKPYNQASTILYAPTKKTAVKRKKYFSQLPHNIIIHFLCLPAECNWAGWACDMQAHREACYWS